MPSTILVAASLPSAGASNISADGSSFDLELSPPMTFPKDAQVQIALSECSVWFNFPNLSAKRNNNKLYYTDDNLLQFKYTITLDDGLYSLASINEAMNLAFIANGHPESLFEFKGVEANGYILLTKLANATAFKFSFGASSPHSELGFLGNTSYPSSVSAALYNIVSPNQALLNAVTTVMVGCSLANSSSRVGRGLGNILASFSPGDASPGQLISYKPNFAQWVDCNILSGSSVSRITFYLTDQTGLHGTISTNEEPFSLSLLIQW